MDLIGFRRNVLGTLALLTLAGALVAGCSDDDGDGDGRPPLGSTGAPAETTGGDGETDATGSGDADEEEIGDFVTSFIGAYNEGDADAFFGDMTDDGARSFLSYFGVDTSDLNAAREEAAPFIGEDPIEILEIEVINSTDNSATAEMIGSSAGILEGDIFELMQIGDDWKVNSLQLFAVSPEIPDGYSSVELELTEFAFDPGGEVAPGEVAFTLQNRGQQPHEAILAKLDENVVLEEALQEESEDEPEGIEVVGGVFNIAPGATYNMVLTEELEAGRYAFVCFLPDTSDPAGTPHAFKGMVHEFTIE